MELTVVLLIAQEENPTGSGPNGFWAEVVSNIYRFKALSLVIILYKCTSISYVFLSAVVRTIATAT